MNPSDQPQLFLCHSSVDKSFVHDLAADLIEVGIHVWLDRWKLGVGDSLIDCISSAIASAAYVGVVISPDSINSRWCTLPIPLIRVGVMKIFGLPLRAKSKWKGN